MIHHRLVAPEGLAPTSIELPGGAQLQVPLSGIVEIPHALTMPGDLGVFEPVDRTVETAWLRELLHLGFRHCARRRNIRAAQSRALSGRDVLRSDPRAPVVVVGRRLARRRRNCGWR